MSELLGSEQDGGVNGCCWVSPSQDEYQFCYQAALEYLGSFDHYAT